MSVVLAPCGHPLSAVSVTCPDCVLAESERSHHGDVHQARLAAQDCDDCRARPGIWSDLWPAIPSNPCPKHILAKG